MDKSTTYITLQRAGELIHGSFLEVLAVVQPSQNEDGFMVGGMMQPFSCPKCGFNSMAALANAPQYPDCEGCKAQLALASDNGGPWYHIAKNGTAVPHRQP